MRNSPFPRVVKHFVVFDRDCVVICVFDFRNRDFEGFEMVFGKNEGCVIRVSEFRENGVNRLSVSRVSLAIRVGALANPRRELDRDAGREGFCDLPAHFDQSLRRSGGSPLFMH